MSDERLKRARECLAQLCNGKLRWTMCVPVRKDDTDILLADGFDVADEACAERDALKARLALLEPVARAAKEWDDKHLEGSCVACYGKDPKCVYCNLFAAVAALREQEGG